jgi:hypothetical protein
MAAVADSWEEMDDANRVEEQLKQLNISRYDPKYQRFAFWTNRSSFPFV